MARRVTLVAADWARELRRGLAATEEPLQSPCEVWLAVSEAVGVGLVVFELSTLVVVVAQLALGARPQAWAAGVGLVAGLEAVVLVLREAGRLSRKAVVGALLIFAAVGAAAGACSAWFIDTSWDGQWYHQEELLQIHAGWNPWTSEAATADPIQQSCLNHYPLGAELSGYPLFAATGRIETMKFFNFTAVAASLALAFAALLAVGLSRTAALVLAGIAALNPVSVCQMTGTYVDGRLSSYCVIAAAAAVLWLRRASWSAAAAWSASLVLLVLVKFTGVGYAAIAAAALVVAAWAFRGGARARKAAVWSAGFLLAAFFLLGWHPYVTNWRAHGSPFFPVRGEGAVDVVSANRPRSFEGRNRLVNLAVSLAAETSQACALLNREPELKAPFRLHRRELFIGRDSDARMAGWGPLFSGALLLAVACFAASWRRDRRRTLIGGFVVGAILVCAVANPESWWARFCPQIALAPIVVAAALFASRPKGAARALGIALVAALALNVALVASFHAYAMVGETRDVRAQLAALAARGTPIAVDFGAFPSNRRRFDEWGIRWREVKAQGELKPPIEKVPWSTAVFSAGE